MDKVTKRLSLSQVGQSPITKACENSTPGVGGNLDPSTLVAASAKKTPRRVAKVFPEESIPDLIRLVHGNNFKKVFLAKEFSAFLEKVDSNSGQKGTCKCLSIKLVIHNTSSITQARVILVTIAILLQIMLRIMKTVLQRMEISRSAKKLGTLFQRRR